MQDQALSLDFWYDFSSPCGYVSVMRIGLLATRHGVVVRWRPFLPGSFPRGEDAWTEVARQARKLAMPWRRPSRFPRSVVLPARIALAGADTAWGPAFSQAVMRMNFVHDREVDTEEAMEEVLYDLGLPARAIIAAAQADDHKLRLRRQTEEAQRLGLSGAPAFIVRGAMFSGGDRMEDAFAHCLQAEETPRDAAVPAA